MVEVSLAGYTALTGTDLDQDDAGQVRPQLHDGDDGWSVPGEGFTGPNVNCSGSGSITGTISFYIMGETGTLTVSAVAGNSATIVSQTTVTLSGQRLPRVVLSGLALTGGQRCTSWSRPPPRRRSRSGWMPCSTR